MASQDIEVGDKVQWNYGGGHPQGTAAEIRDQPGEKVQIVSQKGNTVTRNADEENPAVRVERRGEGNGNDVVKRMSELKKVGEGSGDVNEGEKAEEPTVGQKRGPGELVGETEGEKAKTTATTPEKAKKTRAKKAKTETEAGKGEEHAEGAETSKPSKRGRGRGRGRAAASTGRRKSLTRAKKGSTGEAHEAAKEPTGEESTTVDVTTTEADAPGEPDTSGDVAVEETPAAHTRSQT